MTSILIDVSQFLLKQSVHYLQTLIYNCQLQRCIVIDGEYRRVCSFYHQKVDDIDVIRIDGFMQCIPTLLPQLVQKIAVFFIKDFVSLALVCHLYLFIQDGGGAL